MSQKLFRFAGIGAGAVGLFAAAGVANATVPTLNPTSVTVGLGQSTTITANVPVYMLSNTDGSSVGVSANGTQVVITGQALGGSAVRLCNVGTASDCTNLNVTVQVAAASGISFNPNNFSLPMGSSQAVVVTGGNGTYSISGASSTATAYATLSSSTLSVYATAAGSASFMVCDSTNACGSVSLTVTSGATQNQAVTFNPASPTVAAGQTTTVSLSGNATGYIILTNVHPELLTASISGTTLSLTGVQGGTDSLVICATGGDCSTLSVTVTGSAASTGTTTTTTTTTTGTTTTTPPPTTTTTTGGTTVVSAGVLVQITALQNAVTQIIAALQAIQAQLTQLKSQVTVGATVSTNTGISSGSVSVSGTLTDFLSLNSEGPQVTLLQQKLTAAGFYSGPITGFYGSLTQQAVMKFQTAHGINPTGYVGPSTRAALN